MAGGCTSDGTKRGTAGVVYACIAGVVGDTASTTSQKKYKAEGISHAACGADGNYKEAGTHCPGTDTVSPTRDW